MRTRQALLNLWRRPARMAVVGFIILLLALPLATIPYAGISLSAVIGAIGGTLLITGLLHDRRLNLSASDNTGIKDPRKLG